MEWIRSAGYSIAIGLLLSSPTGGALGQDVPGNDTGPETGSLLASIYVPPARKPAKSTDDGATRREACEECRIGAGTRGGVSLPVLAAIVPYDHVALTTLEQPTLYWYQSASTTLPIIFSIVNRKTSKTLFDDELPGTFGRGLHRIRLSDLDVSLEEDILYKWHITLAPDPDRRSHDVVCGGLIELRSSSSELGRALAEVGAADRAGVYGQDGIWYDMFSVMSDQVSASETVRDQRAQLLEAIGLSDAAAYARTEQ